MFPPLEIKIMNTDFLTLLGRCSVHLNQQKIVYRNYLKQKVKSFSNLE